MIVFVVTASHCYTHRAVERSLPAFHTMTYRSLFGRVGLPTATYIFSDFDRLGFRELELAAHAHRSLQSAGCRVLNDPARALQRLPLLRRLHREAINSFTAWPAG